MNSPDLFQFQDVAEYLNALFEARRSLEPGFTYEAWATELGFKSRSFMRMICNKERRLTDDFTTTFVRAMNFTDIQSDFFRLLVDYSQSTSPKERLIYFQQMSTMLQVRVDRVEIENHHRFLSSPLLPRLHLLLGFEDIEKTPRSLAPFFPKRTPRSSRVSRISRIWVFSRSAPTVLTGRWQNPSGFSPRLETSRLKNTTTTFLTRPRPRKGFLIKSEDTAVC